MNSISLRRIAAEIMKIGRNRVRITSTNDTRENLSGAMTRADVAGLIKEKIVYSVPVKGRRKKEKRKGNGPGKRKGTSNARMPEKEAWMKRIRALRKYLNKLVDGQYVDKSNKRMLYLKLKGGYYRSKAAFYAYLKDNSLLLKDAKEVK
jgi:large subunit ribosomal protein L19e